MVALVIGGMAVAGAGALLSGLGDRAEAIERVGQQSDHEANAERLLRALVANLEPSPDSTPSFVGDPTSAAFHSWCETPAGWLDPCSVRLFFEKHDLRLELRGADSSDIALRHWVKEGRLRYYVIMDYRGSWKDRWSHLVPPAAIAVIMDADTLLLAVWGT